MTVLQPTALPETATWNTEGIIRYRLSFILGVLISIFEDCTQKQTF